jgi:hypothetical protein
MSSKEYVVKFEVCLNAFSQTVPLKLVLTLCCRDSSLCPECPSLLGSRSSQPTKGGEERREAAHGLLGSLTYASCLLLAVREAFEPQQALSAKAGPCKARRPLA